MKKIIIILTFIFCFFSFLCLPTVKAEEIIDDETVETPVEPAKVYTLIEDENVCKITLLEDNKCQVYVNDKQNGEVTVIMTYVKNENGHYEIYLGKELWITAILNDENMTWQEYVAPEEPEIVYDAFVKIMDTSYGTINVSKVEGMSGELVEIELKPYLFCALKEVKVNGATITPNENGLYQFVLVEGENTVSAEFIISEENMSILLENIDKAEKGNWEEIFELKNIMNLISWVLTGIYAIGFMFTLRKNKNIKSLTGTEIAAAVSKKIPETVEAVITDTFEPIIKRFAGSIENIEKCVASLNRCMILTQENTPESRIAILNELTNIGKETEALKTEAVKIIEEEIARNKMQIEKTKESIEKLEVQNEQLLNEGNNEVKGRI